MGDVRNSPATTVAEHLHRRSADLELVDPHVDATAIGGTDHHPADAVDDLDLQSLDTAIALVDHAAFAYDALDDVPLAFDAQDALPEDISTTVVTLGDGWPPLEQVTTRPTVDDG